MSRVKALDTDKLAAVNSQLEGAAAKWAAR